MARIRNKQYGFRVTVEENKDLLKLLKQYNTDITNLINKLIKEEIKRLRSDK